MKRALPAIALFGAIVILPACESIKDLFAPIEDTDDKAADDSGKKKRKKKKKKQQEREQEDVAEGDARSPDAPAPPPNLKEMASSLGVPVPAETARDAGPEWFGDRSKTILEQMRRRFGATIAAIQIEVFKDYLRAELRKPNDALAVEKFAFESGAWAGPEPVTRNFPRSTEERTAQETFDPAEVDWTSLPGVFRDAISRSPIGGTTLTHAVIARFLPFESAIQIRVHYSGEAGRRGYADYDAKGHFKKVGE